MQHGRIYVISIRGQVHLMESEGNQGNCTSGVQRELPLFQLRKALWSRITRAIERSRKIGTGGRKMFQALNYLWSCCYFDSYCAGAACMVISPSLPWIVQECCGFHLLSGRSFPKPQNPNECVFLLNGSSFEYETNIFGLNKVNTLMAFILLVFVFKV